MPERITDKSEMRKHDHQLRPIQKKFIDAVDQMLALKEEGSTWSFIDLRCVKGFNEAIELVQSCDELSEVLSGHDEQLAIETDGEYYPVFDVTKASSSPVGISLRAWGWEDEKVRYKRGEGNTLEGYIVYEGEKDHTRELDISFHYRQGKEHIVETVSLYGSTMNQSNPRLYSQIWMSAYAETGYEGHGGHSAGSTSDETIEKFIEIAERLTGAIND